MSEEDVVQEETEFTDELEEDIERTKQQARGTGRGACGRTQHEHARHQLDAGDCRRAPRAAAAQDRTR